MFWWDREKIEYKNVQWMFFFGNHSSRIKFDYNGRILKTIIYSNSYVWNVLIDGHFYFSLVIFIVVVSDFVNKFFQVLLIVLLVGPIFWRIKKLFIDSLNCFWHFQIKILKLESLHVIKFPTIYSINHFDRIFSRYSFSNTMSSSSPSKLLKNYPVFRSQTFTLLFLSLS